MPTKKNIHGVLMQGTEFGKNMGHIRCMKVDQNIKNVLSFYYIYFNLDSFFLFFLPIVSLMILIINKFL